MARHRKSGLIPEPYGWLLCGLSKMDLAEIAWTMALNDPSGPNTDEGLYRKLLLAREDMIGLELQRPNQVLTLTLWRPLRNDHGTLPCSPNSPRS